MKYDVIVFTGALSMVRRFNKWMRNYFNGCDYPSKETRHGNGFITVTYKVMQTRDFFNSERMLYSIAENATIEEFHHNRNGNPFNEYNVYQEG